MTIQVKQVQGLRSELDSKQNLKLSDSPTGTTIQLDLLDHYFQFLLPSSPTTIKLPEVGGADYFEVEIANEGDGTNAIIVTEFDETAIATLSASTGLRTIYCYWDNSKWQVWERAYYGDGTPENFLRESDIGVTVQPFGEYATIDYIESLLSSVAGVRFTEGATPPASPNNGDEWLRGRTLYKRCQGAWVNLLRVNDFENITRVSSGFSNTSLPTHQAGDLIICYAFREAESTPPPLPSGWTGITTRNVSSSAALRIAYKIASSNSESYGWGPGFKTFTAVYRGIDVTSPIGNVLTDGSASFSSTLTFPSLTISSGYSWLSAFAGTVGETIGTDSPDGLYLIDDNLNIAGYDSNKTITNWSSKTITASSTQAWITAVVELKSSATTLTFPSTPTLGQIYSNRSVSWIWNGVAWDAYTP
jgi:hypothetical protein